MRYRSIPFLILFLISLPLRAGQTLFVYIPTTLNHLHMQEAVQQACSNVSVTTFQRGKEFVEAVTQSSPNAILTLKPVISATPGYAPHLAARYRNDQASRYVLVSVNSPLNVRQLAGKKLGVIDLFGRKPMEHYVQGLLTPNIKIKRVYKQEDLLPLLTFGVVDGVFVSQLTFEQLKRISQLALVAAETNIELGGITFAQGTDPIDSQVLQNCATNTLSRLGEAWEVTQWTGL